MAGPQWLPYIDQDFARKFEREFRAIDAFLQNSSTTDLWRHYQQCIAPHGSDPWDTRPQRRLVLALLAGLRACRERSGDDHRVLVNAAGVLLRRKLPFTPEDAAFLLDVVLEHPSLAPEQFPVAGVLSAVELAVARQPLSPELRDRLHSVRQLLTVDKSAPVKAREKLVAKIDRLCNDSIVARLQADGGWADAVCETVRGLAPEPRAAWEGLLLHAAAVAPARPPADWSVSMKDMEHLVTQDLDRWYEVHDRRVLSKQPAVQWSAAAEQHIVEVGQSAFMAQMIDWLERLPRSRPGYLVRESLNREMLRGLLWFSTGIGEPMFVQALRMAGEFLYRKNSPLGTTVVQVLYRIPDRTAITELSLMRGRVKPKARERLVALALRERASEAQIPPDDVEDLALPTLGMTEIGVRRQELQGYTAELAVAKAGRVELRWINPDGRQMKSVPAKVAASHAGEVRELKLAAKELRATLQTLAARFESAWIDQRRWTFSVWRERSLDHPVAGVLSRRLVWSFHEGERTVAGAWHEGQLVDLEARALRPAPGAQVTLWHPAEAAVAEVAGWREWLYRCEMMQPFKQAHREIYLLTDAERATGTYSNRFAAHILRQPSFRALAKGRGWEAPYCGPWDSGGGGAARRRLESWGLQAEWWIDGAGDGHAPAGGYAYVATDQVRFCRIDLLPGTGRLINTPHEAVVLLLNGPALSSRLSNEQRTGSNERCELGEGHRKRPLGIEQIRSQRRQRLAVPGALGNRPVHAVLAECRHRPVRHGRLDPRLQCGGKDRAVATVRVPDHSDPRPIDIGQALEIIDGPHRVPDVLTVNRPLGELLVKARRIVRRVAGMDAFAIPEIVRGERNEASFRDIHSEAQVRVRRLVGP